MTQVMTNENETPGVLALLESFTSPAILLDLDYRIQLANTAYRDLYGDGKPLRQRRCYEVSHGYKAPCDQAGENCPIHASLESGEPQRMLHVHHTPHDAAANPKLNEHTNKVACVTCHIPEFARGGPKGFGKY